MFNVGGPEVLAILLLALIVLGPQRLPDAARQVGRMMGEVRKLSNGFQAEVRSAFEEVESTIKAPISTDAAATVKTDVAVEDATGAEAAALEAQAARPAARPANRPVKKRTAPLRARPAKPAEK